MLLAERTRAAVVTMISDVLAPSCAVTTGLLQAVESLAASTLMRPPLLESSVAVARSTPSATTSSALAPAVVTLPTTCLTLPLSSALVLPRAWAKGSTSPVTLIAPPPAVLASAMAKLPERDSTVTLPTAASSVVPVATRVATSLCASALTEALLVWNSSEIVKARERAVTSWPAMKSPPPDA